MKKSLVYAFVVLLLAGCSSKDMAMFNSALNQSTYSGGNGCEFEDLPSELFHNGKDVKVYYSGYCNTDFLTFHSKTNKDLDCEANYDGATTSFILYAYKKEEVSFSAVYDPEIGYECSIYNQPETISSSSDELKYKFSYGRLYYSYFNTHAFDQSCIFKDSNDYTLKSDMIVKSETWSDWVATENGVKVNCDANWD